MSEPGPAQPDARIKAHQAIRIQRLMMTLGSYSCTLMLVLACAAVGLLKPVYAIHYVVAVLLINSFFYGLFRSNLNLRLHDPNLTAPQMLLSILPALYVMYFVATPQARGSFLLLAVVPLLYGVFGLNTRRFVAVGVLNLLMYLGLIGLILHFQPARIDPRGDAIQVVALLACTLQIALLGGYIFELRTKLRSKTDALDQALVRISEMANRDELTGVFNRRYLMNVVEAEVARCRRGGESFCICMLDIDHFKHVNDSHGHPAGDLVLKKVAEAAGADLRQTDCFGRYGGEEFLLVMPQTQLSGAKCKAERIREQVAALKVPELGHDFRVTLSAGVSQYRPGESPAALIKRADLALYCAKEQGRNRVVAGQDTAAA